jgi:hypothetical protein
MALVSPAASAQAIRQNGGFMAMEMGPVDDGTSGEVPLGFTVRFARDSRSQVFVSNNGYLAFGRPGGEQFTSTVFTQILFAPFFADVDTRGSGSATAHWGTDVVDGHAAFAATWPGVGSFMAHAGLVNHFQVVVVDRSDVKDGSFDLEMNYDSILWECGDAECADMRSALVGFSDGITDTLLPGSNVAGAFLDTNTVTGLVHGSRGSPVLGRYVFEFRDAPADAGPGSPPVDTPFGRGCLFSAAQLRAHQPFPLLALLLCGVALSRRRHAT